MKRVSKFSNIAAQAGRALVIASLLGGLILVQPAAAAGCGTVTTTGSQALGAINGKIGAMNSNFSDRLNALKANQDELDKKITDTRSQVAISFEEKITALEATPNLSSTQSAAIAQYKSAMQGAEAARTTAVDEARAAYRTALNDTVKSYQDSLSGAANSFKSTVDYLFNTYAKTECAKCTSDTCKSKVIGYVKSYTTSAKSTLNGARSTNDVKGKISAAAQTRNQAIAAANETFNTTATQLAQTLAQALNATPPSDSNPAGTLPEDSESDDTSANPAQ